MFVTATVQRVDFNPMWDRFWLVAEVVLFQPTSDLHIDPTELEEFWQADRLKNKGVGAHLITIRGPGEAKHQVGDTLKALASFKQFKN
jgi:hypothetical protein